MPAEADTAGNISTGQVEFVSLLGSGKEMGVELTYRIQDEPGGIAQALGMAEGFAGAEKVAVAPGGDIFSDDLSSVIRGFDRARMRVRGCF